MGHRAVMNCPITIKEETTWLAPCESQMIVFERERTVYVGFSRYMVGYKPSETHLKPSLKRISQVGYED